MELSIARAGMISGIAAVIAMTSAQPALADDDYPNELAEGDNVTKLEPISPWNIDFAADKCRLARLFGTGGDDEERHFLFFEQVAPQSGFAMTMAGPEIARYRNGSRVEMGMEGNEPMERLETLGRRGTVASIGPAIVIATRSLGRAPGAVAPYSAGIDLDEAANVDRIVLRRSRRVLSIETGNMMAPFQALNACTFDLLESWGLDPEQHRRYTPAQWQNMESIARRIQANYPRRALNSGENGNFRMRVIIETDGSVSDCFMGQSTETRRLESPACDEMSDAVFTPAKDSAGNPIRSFYATSISYRAN
ncbi:MAG: energy transducer TonB [Erythrobacter sp.]